MDVSAEVSPPPDTGKEGPDGEELVSDHEGYVGSDERL